jgi:hypothetical protein
MLGNLGWGPSRDEMATVFSRSRSQIEDVVGSENSVPVMLDNQDRIPQVTQAVETLE